MTFNWTLVIIAILTCVDSYSARSLKNYKGHEMFDGNWKDFAKFCSATEDV